MKLKVAILFLIITILIGNSNVQAKEIKIGVTPSIIMQEISDDEELLVNILVANQSSYKNEKEKEECSFTVNFFEKYNWVRIDENDNNFLLNADEHKKINVYIKKPKDIEINKEYKVILDINAISNTNNVNESISTNVIGTISIPIFLKNKKIDDYKIESYVIDNYIKDSLSTETIFSLTSKLILFNKDAYRRLFQDTIKFKLKNNNIIYDNMFVNNDEIIHPTVQVKNRGDITILAGGTVKLYNNQDKLLDNAVYSYTVVPSNTINEIKTSMNISDYAQGVYLLKSNIKLSNNIDKNISFEIKNIRWICILLTIIFYIILTIVFIILIKKLRKRRIIRN